MPNGCQPQIFHRVARCGNPVRQFAIPPFCNILNRASSRKRSPRAADHAGSRRSRALLREATREHEVRMAVHEAMSRNWRLFILGGGSNLVISDSGWPGLVVKIATRG